MQGVVRDNSRIRIGREREMRHSMTSHVWVNLQNPAAAECLCNIKCEAENDRSFNVYD
jgi:hypothetical protein